VQLALFTEKPESVISSVLVNFETGHEMTSVTRLQAVKRGSRVRRRTRSIRHVSQVLIIMDPGQDLDDEMTLVMLRALWDRELVHPVGIVTTLEPADMRAQLAHGTLAKLGLTEVPVAAGSDGGAKGTVENMVGVEYVRKLGTVSISADAFMTENMERMPDRSLTFVVVASLSDIANQLKRDEVLFKRKVKEVVLMGGVKPISPGQLLEPDTAHNNQFDMEATEFFYRRCQELGIPLLIVSRYAAYTCQLPRSIYDDMAETGSHVGKHLRNVQAQSIEQLWRRANAPEGSELRAGLPMRCDKAWFCKTFCGGDGLDRTGDDSIWDLIQGFNMYDPVALIAAIPKLSYFFDFTEHELNGATHRIIGVSNEQTGVKDGQKLRSFLYKGFMDGIQGEIVKEQQRRDLLERQRKQLSCAIEAIEALRKTNSRLNAEIEDMHELTDELSRGRSCPKLVTTKSGKKWYQIHTEEGPQWAQLPQSALL